jgi:CDGSH-type Zn-finger protein
MKNEPKLKVSKNGPYLVSGNIPMEQEIIVEDSIGCPTEWKKLKDYPAKESYSLCRCGKSKNPPFCDGAHIAAKFDGKETASKEKYSELSETIHGPELNLTDAECYCSVGRFCHKGDSTWNLVEESNDPKAKAMAIESACNCPSGRLVVWDKKTHKPIEPDFKPSISLTEEPNKRLSGPLWVKGGIAIEAADGSIYETRNRVTLCRCGRSENKPFCDGSHLAVKFKVNS